MRHVSRLAAIALFTFCLVIIASSATPTLANAAPLRTWFEGVLRSSNGGPATDGDYDLTFAIYEGKAAKTAVWSSAKTKVKVANGQFAWLLGSAKALDANAIASLKDPWIGVQVGVDPELPRVALGASLWAVRADVAGTAAVATTAKGLSCTGCVNVAALKFDGDVDLGANSIKGKNATFTGNVQAGAVIASSVTAQQFVGDGAKLTGIKMPGGTCKSGEVVRGINADGSLNCVAMAAITKLPIDAIDDVSNGLISNEFINVISINPKNLPIPDNTGVQAVAQLKFPNLGTPKAFSVQLVMTNSDLSNVSVVVLPPDDKAKGWVLCDPCGKTDEKSFNKTYTKDAPPKSGDIAKWSTKNPAGTWTLKVLDSAFCVPQKPGNNAICDVAKKIDGAVVDFNVKATTISDAKIQVKGNLITNGGLQLGTTTDACSAALKGRLQWSDNEGTQVCNGTEWVAAKPRPVVWQGGCSVDGSSSWRYYCTDTADINTAGRYLSASSTKSGSSTANSTGKITIKIAGYYRVGFSSWGRSYQRYFELYKGSAMVVDGQNYNAGNTNNYLNFDKVLWLNKGETLNLRLYSSGNSPSWYGTTVTSGNKTLLRRSWMRIEYMGHEWKTPKCGDGELDPGEECDDGNTKNDDTCSNTCKSNITTAVWTASSYGKNPSVNLGTIPGKTGKKIVITKVGMCGDSDQSSGANRFYVSGGGIGFRFAAGQSNPGSVNQWLGFTPTISGSARGFVYKTVSYTASVGASVSVTWDYHSDWDGRYCDATDSEGNKYTDQTSTVRPWILYEYK